MSELPKQVIINGDVNGQIAIGNYINQFRDLNGCNITINPPDDRPSWERHSKPTKIKPRPPRVFLDRTTEIKLIENAIQSEQPMTLSGVTGIGKSTLLKQLANLIQTDHFPDGIYCCSAYNLKLGDLLQCLFSAFYESRVPVKPDRAQIQIALQEIQALILIDDLTLTNDEIQIIQDIAPKCTFVIASTTQALPSESETIRLGGLPDNESITLFEQELGRSLGEKDRPLAQEICHLLKGHPENIRWVAAKIREDGVALETIVAKLKDNPLESLFLETVQALPKIEQQILSILAVVDGRTMPQEHLTALIPSDGMQQAFKHLTARNLVEAHSPAFSVSESFYGMLARSWNLSSWEEVVIKYFVNWAAQKPDEELIENIQDTLLILMKKASKRKNWPWVISLGRALESIFILRGHWQAWNDILHLILEASRALGNRAMEGWALHQLGSEALCMGAKEQALKLLNHSASIRHSIGDQAGLKLTQHNLSILSGTTPISKPGQPTSPSHTFLGTIIGVGAVAVTGLIMLTGFIFYRPAAPALIQPLNGDILETSTRPEFNWNSVLGGTTYSLQVDDQQDFISPVYEFTTPMTSQTPDMFLKQGAYYWRVQAISRFNRAGNWSETWKFTISIPPGKPILSQPLNQFVETKSENLVFTWDKADNSAYYLIQIDDNNDFSSPQYENKVANNNLSPAMALKQGDYYWRVRACNAYDTPGEWSVVWKFTISTPPMVPTLSHPANGHIETATTSPTFEWSEAENSTLYQIQVDDNQDFSSPQYDNTSADTYQTLATPLAQGIYYWQVRAFNMYNTAGNWSDTWKFTISIPPTAPSLVSPVDGFLESTTASPSFQWNGVQNGVSYQIQVDNSQSFGSPEYETKTVDTSGKPATDLAQDEYTWRVRAFNAYDTPGEWSKTWKFTISIPPIAPNLMAPPNGFKLETTTTPTLTWQSVPNAVQYQVQVDNSTAFDSPEYDTKASDTSRTPSNIFSQGVYYWRVRAFNKYDTPGQWSSAWQFIISTPPGIPTLLEPPYNTYVFTAKPSFKWQAATNAAKYQLQVDNSSSFSAPEYDNLSSFTTLTIGSSLTQGTYYWRVRAFNSYDTAGSWSSVWQFTVSIPPGTPILINPFDDQTLGTTTPTLNWQTASNAVTYEVQVDDVYTFDSIPSIEYEISTSGTSVKVNNKLPEGKHWWRVRALNNYGTPGAWSSNRKFFVIIPPGIPNLYEPYNGSPIDYSITPNPVKFRWSNVGNATNYQIQISNTTSFTSTIIDTTTGSSTDISIYMTSFVPVQPSCTQNQYPYYWRVRAISAYGTYGPWSSTWYINFIYHYIC